MHLQAQGHEIALEDPMLAAISHLVIRNANAALSEDPNNALAFVLLGDAFRYLGALEGQAKYAPAAANAAQQQRRFYEAANAYRQALIVNPRDYLTQAKLVELYSMSNKLDLALAALEEYLRLVAGRQDLPPQELDRRQRMATAASQLKTRVEDTRTRIQTATQQQQADVLSQARAAYSLGLVLYAIELLEDEPNFLALNPEAQLMQAVLLLEAGRAEEASTALGKIEGIAESYPNLDWRWPASLAFLANGQFENSVRSLTEQDQSIRERQLTAVMQSMPLVQSPRDWPAGHTSRLLEALYGWPVERLELDLNAALTYLESGQVDRAEEVLRKTIEENPDTPLRLLALFYLTQITDETFDVEPPHDWIPVTPDMFVEESVETAHAN
jgi:tetratricopeptide (TPR) repeat protein